MNHVLANNALPLAIEIQGFCLMHEVRLATYCSICAAVIFLMNFFLTWVHGHLSQLAHVVVTGCLYPLIVL